MALIDDDKFLVVALAVGEAEIVFERYSGSSSAMTNSRLSMWLMGFSNFSISRRHPPPNKSLKNPTVAPADEVPGTEDLAYHVDTR
jgi:hypothetical protein